MIRAIWRRWKPDPEGELSFFLVAYLLGLLGALLLVHLLQPARDTSGFEAADPPDRQRAKIEDARIW